MIVTLVRHAEVIEEYQHKYNGHIDIPLSKKGKTQAKELHEKLKNIDFKRVYCSDLLRAKETLLELKIDAHVTHTQQLREKSWGRHEGMSFEEITAEGIVYENFEQWISALDGERVEDFVNRVEEFFFNTVFKEEVENILIVTHSGVIKTLLHLTKKISLEEAFATPLPYGSFITFDTMSL